MTRNRRKSEADEALEALGDFLRKAPAWVGPLIALAVYLVLRFVLPPIIGSAGKPIGSTFASFSSNVAPLGALVVLVIWGIAELTKSSRRRMLDSRPNMESIRSLSWQEFERLVGEAYRRKGYTVTETGGGGADGGVDLDLAKDGEKTLVQCKQWRTSKVGVKIVRELYGVMAAKGAAGGIVVTCGQFTSQAKAFARGKPLELVDGRALWELVEAVKTDPMARPPRATAPAAATARPSSANGVAVSEPDCPHCGATMVLRTARKGPHAGSQFYGCPRYPKCHGTRELEARSS